MHSGGVDQRKGKRRCCWLFVVKGEIVVVVPGATNPSLALPHFPLFQTFCFIHKVPYDNDNVHICSM